MAKRWRISLRGMLIVVALIALALGLSLQYRQSTANHRLIKENARLREEVAKLEFEHELERVAFLLKVPTEALYHDCMPRRELNQIRWQALEKFDVEGEFVPVYKLYTHTRNIPALYQSSSSGRSEQVVMTTQGSFWEGYAINHADDGAQLLVGQLKHSEEFRRRLTEDTQLVEQYVKPLLMRLVRSLDDRARFAAIEALLLLGDRSTEVSEILRQSLQRPDKPPNGASTVERVKFYSLNPEQARRLVKKIRLAVERSGTRRRLKHVD